jgi:NCAIR mutase (PurE)-related protein
LLKIAENFNKQKEPALFTRLKKKQLKALEKTYPQARINKTGRTLILNPPQEKHFDSGEPFIAVVSAGTSDLPVVEQACEVCVAMNTAFEKIVDAGVAGLHRILFKVELLQKASAVVVIAGMEGALPSVVGGLVDCPVFAVPTSVGYGASFQGLSALLAMLNSCAPGVMVSNIDNGFTAAFAACQVIRMIRKETGTE